MQRSIFNRSLASALRSNSNGAPCSSTACPLSTPESRCSSERDSLCWATSFSSAICSTDELECHYKMLAKLDESTIASSYKYCKDSSLYSSPTARTSGNQSAATIEDVKIRGLRSTKTRGNSGLDFLYRLWELHHCSFR